MRKSLLVSALFGLVAASTASAFWVRNPERSNPHDPRSARFIGTTTAPGGAPPALKVTVKLADGTPVSGAIVQIGTDAAGALGTDSSGAASFSTASLPADVHIFSPLSSGTPLHDPNIITLFGLNNTDQEVRLWFPSSLTPAPTPTTTPSSTPAPAIHACFQGITPATTSSKDYEVYFQSGQPGGGGGGGGGADSCNGTFWSSAPNYQVNVSYIGYSASGSVTCAYFEPQFTAPGSPMSFTRTALSTGYTPLSIAVNYSSPLSWPFPRFQLVAGPSKSDYWTLYSGYLNGTTNTVALALPDPPNSFRSWSLSGTQTISGQYHSNNAWGQNGPEGGININLPGPLTFQGSLFSAGNDTIQVQDNSGISGNLWVVSYRGGSRSWQGLRLVSSTGALSFTRPTVLPVGYPASIFPASGASVNSSVEVMRRTLSVLPSNFTDLYFYYAATGLRVDNAMTSMSGTW